MSTTYEPVTIPTRREPSPEWAKEIMLPPGKEKKQDTECVSGAEEQTHVEHRNGNGHLWETVAVSQTFQVAPMRSTTMLETRLAEAQTKSDEYMQKIDELTYALDRVASQRLEKEAVATSREAAMALLSLLAHNRSIHKDDLTNYLLVPEDWLSLSWLMKADLVEHIGSFIIVTDRGRQIVGAVFGK